ncbi:MAG: hypothetical protein Q8L02_06245 [Candidatus Nitrotoga sp.]|nr:hypothetical protein [Candidatus Nitrotoga sp.]
MANLDCSIDVKDYCEGMKIATRKTKWILSGKIPKSADDLSFVGRDGDKFSWWNVIPPKTDYWHAHQILGRAYAFELLDLFNNPKAEYSEHILAYITSGMTRWARTVEPVAAEGMQQGFFEVLSEFLGKGSVNR